MKLHLSSSKYRAQRRGDATVFLPLASAPRAVRYWPAAVASALLLSAALISQGATDPWPKSALVEPATLAKTLESHQQKPPVIIAVAFKVLYDSRHLPHAIYAGPGSSPEGIAALKKAVANLPKNTDIVLYCGCCPMDRCPNIRPAYKTLAELGFTRVRVLHVPTNMHTDWFQKDYPSEGPGAK
jgi:thiosulfate/3-mercaptopyruvate sulfurtransferase